MNYENQDNITEVEDCFCCSDVFLNEMRILSNMLFNPYLDRISVLEACANSAGPVQTPLNAASDQGLHFLLTEISMQTTIKVEILTDTPKTTNVIIQMKH